jgi:hypothetical protein
MYIKCVGTWFWVSLKETNTTKRHFCFSLRFSLVEENEELGRDLESRLVW